MSYTNGIGTHNPFGVETSASTSTRPNKRSVPDWAITLPKPERHAFPQSDVRMDKVTALQLAIANGTYDVSAPDVAAKIIQSMLM